MSDRVAVMSEGHVVQVGPPREVYDRPADAYVADFLGVSNLMDATAHGPAPRGGCRVTIGEFELVAGSGDETRGRAKVVIRPERVEIEPQGATGENRVPGMVERSVFLGPTTHVFVQLPVGRTVQAMIRGGATVEEQGTPVVVHLPRDDLRVLPIGDAAPGEAKAAAAD
jgi:ABC-type Fe3+/spermidine/putrescine transport system ATPase subunit